MIVTVLLQGGVANIVSTTPEDAAKDFLEGLKNNEPQAVSYTHLDVYKRQMEECITASMRVAKKLESVKMRIRFTDWREKNIFRKRSAGFRKSA